MNSSNSLQSAENNYGISKQPVLCDGYGSYYERPLSYDNAQWVVIREPAASFHNNGKFLVKVMKIDNSLPYGSDEREYKDMILENGTITPCSYKVGLNNHDSWVTENGIINVIYDGKGDGYKLYDENFVPYDFPGTPEGRYVGRINMDDGLVTTYSRNREDNISDIMELKQDKSIAKLKGVPEGGSVTDIRDDVIAIVHIGGKHEQYFFDTQAKSLRPFSFLPKKGYEHKSFEVDFIHPDSGYVQITYEDGHKVSYAFNGTTSALTEQINLVSKKQYSGDRYNSETGLLSKYDSKSVALVIFDKEIPFSGLKAGESINTDETLRVQGNSNLPLIVVEYKSKDDDWYPRKECRRYNKVTGEIIPIQGVDANWKVKSELGYGKGFLGVKIKIPGFGDEVLCLLNKGGSSIVRYKGLIINGVSPASKIINLSTKGGPDVSIKLSDNERDDFMKEWNTEYQSTREQIAEAIAG